MANLGQIDSLRVRQPQSPLDLVLENLSRSRLFGLAIIPSSRRQSFPRSDLLVLLVANLTLAKDPFYQLGE